MKPFKQTKLDMPPVKQFIKEQMDTYGITRKQAKWQYNRLKKDIIFVNDKYQVNLDDEPIQNIHPQLVHLSIKRLDKEPIHDWRELQQVKNMICGEDCEAFELYPAEHRVVDVANQFHLFVLPPGKTIPCGWMEGAKSNDEHLGSKQRPRGDDDDSQSATE